MLKILHIENTAGVPHVISVGMRELGYEAKVLETWISKFSFPHDYENYYFVSKIHYIQNLWKILRTINIASNFDIIHFHAGINWKRLDFLLIKIMQHKPVVVHYHGFETREGRGLAYQNLIDAKIVATPDLLKWIPDAYFIPNPIMQLPYSFDSEKTPIILHMPTNRKFKGTDLILKAINELKKENLAFEFRLVENVDYNEALRQISEAHIVIDQVVDERETNIPGLFGKTSLEAMAMGKVSICHLSDEYLRYYPECPIVNVKPNVDDLKSKIRYYVENMDETKALGIKGREYVNKYHNPKLIANRIIEIYKKILH